MQRLGKNHGSYLGETIDIQAVLRDVEVAAQKHGWASETFYADDDFKLFALRRPASRATGQAARIYISTGIHGDEPAGPLAALQLLRDHAWPANVDLWFCPCLNPSGFRLNRRENAKGIDLNREYLKPTAPEILAHIAWLERQPKFDLCLLLHEDWESHGFYLYEQNPDNLSSPADTIIEQVAKICPVDPSDLIEGRPAQNGIIRPKIDVRSRPDWPEAFYVITHKTRQSFTLEAPSDFTLPTRVNALVVAVKTALEFMANRKS
jgi:murein peptide amidase A